MSILVTNDDGRNSKNLEILFRAAKRQDKNTIALVPETPRSGTGKAFTVHKPLRVFKASPIDGCDSYALSGTPADCFIYGNSVLFSGKKRKLDLVVSGINVGDNSTVQSILSSGTIGACFEAALYGIPAIAFSQDAPREAWFDSRRMEKASAVWDIEDFCFKVIKQAREKGLPEGVHVLSINFPDNYTSKTKAVYCKPDLMRFINVYSKRKDPFGKEYYWTAIKENFPTGKDGDYYNLFKRKHVTITPLSIAFTYGDILRKTKAMYKF